MTWVHANYCRSCVNGKVHRLTGQPTLVRSYPTSITPIASSGIAGVVEVTPNPSQLSCWAQTIYTIYAFRSIQST